MKNTLSNPNVKKAIKILKPWAFYIALFLILRYTGALSGISSLANSALLKTGAMDAETASARTEKDFDYNFFVQDLKRNKIDVAQFKGKTIFLNIWATWCGPCRIEMPSIQKLYNKIDRDKIVFIILSVDQDNSFTKVADFLKDKDYTFPVYLPSGNLPPLLQVPSIPTTFVISPQGKIVSKEVGAANYDTEKFKKFLETL